MFDIAWSHLAVIALVALLVIGPKDLPRVLRTVGTWVGKARAVAREFQSSLDQMVREAELDEVKRQVEAASSVNLERELENSIDPGGEMERSLKAPLLTAPSSPLPQAEPTLAAPPPAEHGPVEPPAAAEPAKSAAHD
jgi:sec-independent protein translocase protein TatB